MRTPRKGISKEARDHLHSKLARMKGIQRKKTVKRLERYDRGERARPEDIPRMERE